MGLPYWIKALVTFWSFRRNPRQFAKANPYPNAWIGKMPGEFTFREVIIGGIGGEGLFPLLAGQSISECR
jgi:hypothetical protein